MARIKQLSPHEAQKIAAGEVVERPANIVKELVENSIDAGATRISIYIENAGKQLIRIVDNGSGMDATDAQICFDRHATSKITHVDELETINTFGFRGEALASIAAVSKITLLTKQEQCLEGTQVTVDAHTITQISTTACPTGTDISVQNLFFNVPARKKFLKTDATEWRAIQLLFNAFCFDYPHIHFSLFSDNKQANNCPVTDAIKNRALQLWEPTAHSHLIALHANEDAQCIIEGVISDHQHCRYDRNGIYFFVNKRWVKNHHLSSALIKGYANVIPHGRYPIAAINITVPLHEVDINIHPRKEEVKFLHPRRVEQALQQAVKKALEQNLSQQIKQDVVFKTAEQEAKPIYRQQPQNFAPFNFDAFFAQQNSTFPTPPAFNTLPTSPSFDTPLTGHSGRTEEKSTTQFNLLPLVLTVSDEALCEVRSAAESSVSKDETEQILITQNTLNTDQPTHNFRLIGQYNKTYILIEKEEGLFLVDQHAAHERILYELFANRFTETATVHLMFPQTITLSTHEIDLLLPHLDIFISNGILIEQSSHNQLTIQSLPVHLKDLSMNELAQEMTAWIMEYKTLDAQEFTKTINNKLQAQMACKAAVKAGDELTHEKMIQLLTDLEKTANRFSCPHGRPTGWLLSFHEIEKKFKRKL